MCSQIGDMHNRRNYPSTKSSILCLVTIIVEKLTISVIKGKKKKQAVSETGYMN